jgi:hypothetical protein
MCFGILIGAVGFVLIELTYCAYIEQEAKFGGI